jgi:hypothetical protein
MVNNLINCYFYDIKKQWNCAGVFLVALKSYTIKTATIDKELAETDAYFARKTADEYGAITVDDDYGIVTNQIYYDNYLASNQKRQEINDTKTTTDKTNKRQARRDNNDDYTEYFEAWLALQTTYEIAIAEADEEYYNTVTTAERTFNKKFSDANDIYQDVCVQLMSQYIVVLAIIDSGGDINETHFSTTPNPINTISMNNQPISNVGLQAGFSSSTNTTGNETPSQWWNNDWTDWINPAAHFASLADRWGTCIGKWKNVQSDLGVASDRITLAMNPLSTDLSADIHARAKAYQLGVNEMSDHFHNALVETPELVAETLIDATAVYGGVRGAFAVGKVAENVGTRILVRAPRIKTPATDWTKKAVDKFVGETANAIDAKFPGKVVDINLNVLKPSGKELAGEFDILLDDVVIQVKSGKAREIVGQMHNSTQEALAVSGKKNYRVFGYAPEQSNGYIRVQQYHKVSITNDIEELLEWIGGK